MSIGLVCMIAFVAIAGILCVALLGPLAAKERATKDARIEEVNRYRLVGASSSGTSIVAETTAPESILTTRALDVLDRAVRARGKRDLLVTKLDVAGLRLKPEEWVAIQIGVVAGVGALLALPLGFIGALVGAVVGWLGCRIFLTQKTKKRRAAFDTQLPDSLQLLAGGLRAGFALNQAVGSIVREGTEPTASEFGRALSEVRLGADLEDALANLAERMQSADMELVLMAIHTAREVGGNLAEILDTTVNTMRERVQLRGHVRVLSAEGRLSARVLTGLPILMVGYLRLTKPDFLRPLYTTAPGIVLSIIGVVLLGLGSLWLSRLTKIEV